LADKTAHRIDLSALPATVYVARMGSDVGSAHLRFSLTH
jgi:hypothetical protein